MTGRIHPLFLHLAGCILFLSMPILFSPESLPLGSYLTNPPTQRDLIVYILLLGVFYANYFFLIPTWYFPRKYGAFAGLNLLCLALIVFLPYLLIHPSPFDHPPGAPPFRHPRRLPMHFRDFS